MVEIIITEKELEDYLCKDENLAQHLGLKFVARQVKIEDFGCLDILAYSHQLKQFVLIELKKGQLDAAAYLQILRYKRAFTAKYDREFKTLIIGDALHADLHPVVHHYESDEANSDVNYTLYSLDFNKGIDFSYYSTTQLEKEDAITALSYMAHDKKYTRYIFNKSPQQPTEVLQ